MNRAEVAQVPLAWCSQVHHYGFSSRRPGFESRREHIATKSALNFDARASSSWEIEHLVHIRTVLRFCPPFTT